MKLNKKGELMNNILIQIILIGLILVMFMFSVAGKIESRGVKQQVLEKELSLLISSAEPGMSFGVRKQNLNGEVTGVRVNGNRVFVDVEGLISNNGYPHFSKYPISVEGHDDKFVVKVNSNEE